MQSMKFFVIPGKTYKLSFNEITLENQNVFLPQSPLKVIFEKEDMLNLVIDGFEYEHQKLLNEKFLLLIKYRDKKIYNNYSQKIAKLLAESPIDDSLSYYFIENYIHYKLAELRLVAHLDSKESIGAKELANMPILWNNPAYISFFKKYFTKYFFEVNNGQDYHQLLGLCNIGSSINELLDIMGKDPVVINEKLRELVLLLSLKQVFYHNDFNQNSLNSIFYYMAANSKFSDIKEIANNLHIKLNQFTHGKKLNDFSLSNIQGDKKSLISFKGKKIYLMFVNPNCETCEADIRILKAFQDEISDQVALVTIYTGYNKEVAQQWVKKQKAEWDFLWFDDNFDLLNKYQVKTFPKYIMLDEESNLYNYFPPKPREKLLGYLKTQKKQSEAQEKGKQNKEGAINIFR